MKAIHRRMIRDLCSGIDEPKPHFASETFLVGVRIGRSESAPQYYVRALIA